MRVLAMLGHARSRRGLPALGVAVLVLIAALWIDRHVATWAIHWKCAPLDLLIGAISHWNRRDAAGRPRRSAARSPPSQPPHAAAPGARDTSTPRRSTP